MKKVWIFVLGVASCLAQSDRSTINGLLLDPGGAVAPNAKVEAVNQATQVKYSSTSDQSGLYSLPQIPVGRYDLSVTAPGFSRYVRKDIDVNVAQMVTINATLALATVDQTVEMTSAAPLIQTATAEVGTGVNNTLVVDLPLSVSGNMRNPEAFVFLTPGVTGTTANTQINGSQSRAKEVLLDGVGSTSP